MAASAQFLTPAREQVRIRSALRSTASARDRIRHGIRSAEDPSLVSELAGRGIVLDVCPTSNLRTKVVATLADHPLPSLVRAGVGCSVSTDDPAMFGTDLGQEHELLPRMGVDPWDVYNAAARGALCDEGTRSKLTTIGEQTAWPGFIAGRPSPGLSPGRAGPAPSA